MISKRVFVLLSLTLAGSAAAQPAEPPPPPAPPAPPPAEPETPPAPPAPPPVEPETSPAPPPAPPAVVVAPADKKEDDKAKKPPLEVKPGGYVQFDARRFLNGPETHDMLIRRLRFKLDGSATKYFRFRTLIDFAGSKLVVDDAWAEGVILPELSIRAGKDKVQFGIERLQSAAQLLFLERAYPTQIAPNRDIGVWLRGDIAKGLVHYAFGALDGVADNAIAEAETDNELEYNAHLLISPFATRKQLGDLAIGAATTFGRTEGTLASPGLTNTKSSGQTTILKFPVSTTDVLATALADGYRTRWTVHGYYYRGRAGVLAEYVRDNEPVKLGHSHTLVENSAWQIAGSVALTPGDKPSYKSLKPKRALDPAKGTWGGVELAGRFAHLRIDPAAFDAGILKVATSVQQAREVTFGANWYFNEWLKLQVNYSYTWFDSNNSTEPSAEHLLATRFQASI